MKRPKTMIFQRKEWKIELYPEEDVIVNEIYKAKTY